MATYTASNAIKKIATGDESGTWGDSTNNNADIIDRASNGFVAIALTGTSYTLPLSTTAVLSLGHYKAIRFHGTPGGTCTVTLEQDNKPRMYMIYNNTDKSVIINQGSGSGTKVTIPTGDSAIVLADGAGTNANVIDFTGQITGLSLLTGITAGTVAASKAVVVDANKDITGFRNVTSTGTVTAATLAIGSASLVEAELEMLDGVTAGTVAASKVAVVDANKDITGFRNVTSTGTVTAATLAIGSASLVEAELEMLDGVTAGTVAASKVAVVDANKDISSFRNLTATGAVTAGSLVIGSADISEAELETIDGVTAGTVAASKAVVVNADKDISSFRNLTATGTVTAQTLAIGAASIVEAELERLDGISSGTVTASKVVVAGGSKDITGFRNVTATGAVTAGSLVIGSADISEAELETIDGVTAGTVAASKAVVVDANKDVTGFRNLTMTGGTFTTGLSTFNLLASFNSSHGISCSSYRPPSGVNEVVNFLSSGGDQRLSFQMAALPIQTIYQNSTTLKLKTTALSTARELSYPDASGTLATTNQLITIDGVTAGTVSASKALIVDSSKKLNELLVDNITIDGDAVKFINNQNASNFASITSTHLTSSSSALELRSAGAALTLNSGGSTIPLEYDGTQRGYLKLDTADTIKFYTGTGTGTLSTTISGDDLTVVGAISKGSGSFKIDHPIPSKKDTHHLVHSFLEGPQADLIYRGVVNLVGGSASVNIDTAARMTTGTFVLLCGNVQSFTSNESGWTAVKSSVSGNTLTITAQDNTCTDSVSWMVVGERKDQHMLDTNWTDENGRVIVEPEKQMEE